MQENLKVITKNILRRYPQCKSHLDILPLPDIYDSYAPSTNYKKGEDGKYKLRDRGGDCLSFSPLQQMAYLLTKP